MKKRVYQLAKELKLDTKEIMDALASIGVKVKSQLSSITEKEEKKLKDAFKKLPKKEKKKVKKEKKVIKARKKPQRKKEEKKTVEEKKKVPPDVKPTGETGKEESTLLEEAVEEEEIYDIIEEVKPVYKKKRRKREKKIIDEKEVERKIRLTKARLETSKKKRYKKKRRTDTGVVEEEILRVPAFLSVSELAELLDKNPNAIIIKCLEIGLPVTMNQRIDFDTISLIAEEYSVKVELYEEYEEETNEGKYSNYRERPPVITVMGHVDHGKTTLLDYIRNANVVATEKGGITEKIGAYHISHQEKKITFVDTPGHQAFTAMRARGAKITDIVVLVVAANDGVMPQTIEAVDHAKAAGVPIIVAINKIDLPDAKPERVRQQLADIGVIVQEYGGDVLSVDVSAKTGQGVDELLDTILLLADDMKLQSPYDGPAEGFILEARVKKGFGNVATVIIQKGTLRKKDAFVSGSTYGKVKLIKDENEDEMEEATPGLAVQVISFNEMPQVGDQLIVVESEKEARAIANKRKIVERLKASMKKGAISLDKLQKELTSGELEELKIVLKGDDQGSVEALSDVFKGLSTDEVTVNIIHRGVGEITENDVLLAAASGAIITGYRVKPHPKARELAKSEGVEIRLYEILFEALDDIKKAMSGLLSPEIERKVIGEAEVRAVIKVPKIGNVAGSFVNSGRVVRGYKCLVLRNGEIISESTISSLKRFAEDVREVKSGFECGIGVEDFQDFKEGDIIQVIEIIEKERTL